MTIFGYLTRFLVFYILLILVIGIALSSIGINGGSSVNLGILIFLILWLGELFGKKNGRYFSKNEKVIAIFGMIVLDFLIHLFFAFLTIKSEHLNVESMLVGLGVALVLNAIVIIIFVGMTEKILKHKGIVRG